VDVKYALFYQIEADICDRDSKINVGSRGMAGRKHKKRYVRECAVRERQNGIVLGF
jgi:hypothetical protein